MPEKTLQHNSILNNVTINVMHDYDRTSVNIDYEPTIDTEEMEFDAYSNEYEEPYHDQEFDLDDEFDFQGNPYEIEYQGDGFDDELPFSEEDELELASDLLSVSNEYELEAFLEKAFERRRRRFGRRFGRFVKRAWSKAIKPAIAKLAPIAGQVVGSIYGGPGAGNIGGQLGGLISKSLQGKPKAGKNPMQMLDYFRKMFNLELEGLSPEDQEFEIARNAVRFMGNSLQEMEMMDMEFDYESKIDMAIEKAAQKYAPGLSRARRRQHQPGGRDQGVWRRVGRNKIILIGL